MAEQTIWDELSAEQRELLRGIYELWSPEGAWPSVLDLTRWLRLNSGIRTAARDIMQSFPVVGVRVAFSSSYSAIWFDPHDYGDSVTVRLTPVAGLVYPKFRRLADAYVHVIRLGAERVTQAAPGAGPMELTSAELYSLLDEAFHLFIPHIPDMVQREPVNLYQQIGVPEGWTIEDAQKLAGQWRFVLSETLAEYEGVGTLEEYVEKTLELMSPALTVTDGVNIFTSTAGSASPLETIPAPQTPSASYVNPSLIDELEALPQTNWNLQKLIALLRELNANHASGQPYACLMLCRALLDYVPPVFGVRKFSEMLNNAAGMSETDKKYFKMLGANRLAADDVLHRQIRKNADLIDMHYLPSSAAIDAFVRVVVDRIAEGG